MMPTVVLKNMAAAKQRDINCYKPKRSRQLTPHPDNQIIKGDYVYYRRKTDNTLQIKVGPQVLRVMNVSPNGALTLKGADGYEWRMYRIARSVDYLRSSHLKELMIHRFRVNYAKELRRAA